MVTDMPVNGKLYYLWQLRQGWRILDEEGNILFTERLFSWNEESFLMYRLVFLDVEMQVELGERCDVCLREIHNLGIGCTFFERYPEEMEELAQDPWDLDEFVCHICGHTPCVQGCWRED